jgi:hypothetical protein
MNVITEDLKIGVRPVKIIQPTGTVAGAMSVRFFRLRLALAMDAILENRDICYVFDLTELDDMDEAAAASMIEFAKKMSGLGAATVFVGAFDKALDCNSPMAGLILFEGILGNDLRCFSRRDEAMISLSTAA